MSVGGNLAVAALGIALVILAWRVDGDLRQPAPPEPHYHRWLAHDRAPTPGERR